MELFLVELKVSDWAAALAWYRDRLGLRVELLDETNRYALLAAGTGRLALKAGVPSPGTAKIVFRVGELDAEVERLGRAGVVSVGPVRERPEGYRSVRFSDPDGHAVEVFEWRR